MEGQIRVQCLLWCCHVCSAIDNMRKIRVFFSAWRMPEQFVLQSIVRIIQFPPPCHGHRCYAGTAVTRTGRTLFHVCLFLSWISSWHEKLSWLQLNCVAHRTWNGSLQWAMLCPFSLCWSIQMELSPVQPRHRPQAGPFQHPKVFVPSWAPWGSWMQSWIPSQCCAGHENTGMSLFASFLGLLLLPKIIIRSMYQCKSYSWAPGTFSVVFKTKNLVQLFRDSKMQGENDSFSI